MDNNMHQRALDIAKDAAMFEVLILEQIAEVGRRYGSTYALRILCRITEPFECAKYLVDAMTIGLATTLGKNKARKAVLSSPDYQATEARIFRDVQSMARIHKRYIEAAAYAAADRWPASPSDLIQ